MGHCYSLDLRVRVAAFVEAGHSCRAAARHFGVSDSFAIKLIQRTRHLGSPAPDRQGRPPGGGKLVAYESFLIETVESEPAITMPELAARLLTEHGIVAAPAMLSRFLCRCGFSYKALMAAECARADVRDERRVWHAQRQPSRLSRPDWCGASHDNDNSLRADRCRYHRIDSEGRTLREAASFHLIASCPARDIGHDGGGSRSTRLTDAVPRL